MKLNIHIIFGFIAFMGLHPTSYAQTIDEQLWMDYNLTVQVNKKFSYGGDVGIRGIFSNKDWNQLYFRPTAKYKFNENFSASGGIASFSTIQTDDKNVNEFRVTMDFNAEGPDLLYIILFYRVRLENRSLFYQDLPNDNEWRGRLLMGIESWDFKGFNKKRSFYFQAIWEGFRTLGKESAYEEFINQTRIHAVFGHKLSKKIRYELQYIWQKSREHSDSGLQTTQNVIRFRLYHYIGK